MGVYVSVHSLNWFPPPHPTPNVVVREFHRDETLKVPRFDEIVTPCGQVWLIAVPIQQDAINSQYYHVLWFWLWFSTIYNTHLPTPKQHNSKPNSNKCTCVCEEGLNEQQTRIRMNWSSLSSGELWAFLHIELVCSVKNGQMSGSLPRCLKGRTWSTSCPQMLSVLFYNFRLRSFPDVRSLKLNLASLWESLFLLDQEMLFVFVIHVLMFWWIVVCVLGVTVFTQKLLNSQSDSQGVLLALRDACASSGCRRAAKLHHEAQCAGELFYLGSTFVNPLYTISYLHNKTLLQNLLTCTSVCRASLDSTETGTEWCCSHLLTSSPSNYILQCCSTFWATAHGTPNQKYYKMTLFFT